MIAKEYFTVFIYALNGIKFRLCRGFIIIFPVAIRIDYNTFRKLRSILKFCHCFSIVLSSLAMNFQYWIAILVIVMMYLSDILFLGYITVNSKTILLSVNPQSFSHFISIFSPGSCSIDCLEIVPLTFKLKTGSAK